MNTEKEPYELAQERLKAYLARLKKTSQIDKETIHVFDSGSPSEVVVKASDIQLVLSRLEEIEAQIKNLTIPEIEDNSQNWEDCDPAIAFHLIERHASNWADAGKMMAEFAEAKAAPYKKEIEKLEVLCDQTYVAKGADAYNHATDELEKWQKLRIKQGKDPGTQGSLCDGMAWIQHYVEELEAKLAAKN